MFKPAHLSSAAAAAHALVLELYRFTARWPECEREGLTLEVRRAGHDLSSCVAGAGEPLRARALRRAIDRARGKHARLRYLLRLASDLGYRRLSQSARVNDLLEDLSLDLDLLAGEMASDPALEYPDAPEASARRARGPRRGRPAGVDRPGRERPSH